MSSILWELDEAWEEELITLANTFKGVDSEGGLAAFLTAVHQLILAGRVELREELPAPAGRAFGEPILDPFTLLDSFERDGDARHWSWRGPRPVHLLFLPEE